MTARPRPTIHTSHPILKLDVVGPDGATQSSHRVFCRLRRASVPVGVCCACAHCDAVRAEPAPAVDCTIPTPPEDLEPDPEGLSTEVGTLLCTGTTVLDHHVSVRDALRTLKAGDRRALAIVDDAHVLVGVVHEMAFATRTASTPLTTNLTGGSTEVTWAMSNAMAVHEATPVRAALRILASAHLREATVVTSEGIPLGVFRDVEGLRWLARARS